MEPQCKAQQGQSPGPQECGGCIEGWSHGHLAWSSRAPPPFLGLGPHLAMAPGTLACAGTGTGTAVESGLRPRRCVWQHPLKIISVVPVLCGKLAAFEWRDTSLPRHPGGEKVKYISRYKKKKKKITGVIKFRISRTIIAHHVMVLKTICVKNQNY